MNSVSSPFIETAPADIDRRVAEAHVSADDVLVKVEGDLSDAGTFGSEWLVVTSDQILVVPEGGYNGTKQATIDDLKDVRVDDLVGGGVVEFDTTNGPPVRIGFTQSLRPKFAEIAESLKAMTQGAPLSLPGEIDETRCPTCIRL